MANNRKRSLLDLAHEVHECQNCNAYSTHGCDPAHQNGINAGKGQSIKSQDNRHAALCSRCHTWYDTAGNSPDPSGRFMPCRKDKHDMWILAHLKTFDLYWRNEWLTVS